MGNIFAGHPFDSESPKGQLNSGEYAGVLWPFKRASCTIVPLIIVHDFTPYPVLETPPLLRNIRYLTAAYVEVHSKMTKSYKGVMG